MNSRLRAISSGLALKKFRVQKAQIQRSAFCTKRTESEIDSLGELTESYAAEERNFEDHLAVLVFATVLASFTGWYVTLHLSRSCDVDVMP